MAGEDYIGQQYLIMLNVLKNLLMQKLKLFVKEIGNHYMRQQKLGITTLLKFLLMLVVM